MKKNLKKKVIKHLKDDAKMLKKERMEDKGLIKNLKSDPNGSKKSSTKKLPKKKIKKVMEEFKKGILRSGSKKGPKVTDKTQALAIAINSARKLKRPKK